jgi:beta-mannosidase
MVNKTTISENWKLFGFDEGAYDLKEICSPGYPCTGWYGAAVPGDVHSTLLKDRAIGDPRCLYGDVGCNWVEKRVWIYRTVFRADEAICRSDGQRLLFEGLDTYASVYLNGEELFQHENMFTSAAADVSRILRKGDNVLVAKFDVMSRRADRKLPVGFWMNYSTERAFARKASYSFGWDWTARIATVGIWRPVTLLAFQKAKIRSVRIRTKSMGAENEPAELSFQIKADRVLPCELLCRVAVTDRDGLQYRAECRGGSALVRVPNAHLWWTLDLGEPYLYDVSVEILAGGAVLDRYACRYGIRNVSVLQRDENGDDCFCFLINGVKLFARGANWIPADIFPGAIPDGRYRDLLEMARDAGMNMLSVWGGGIYEKDIFYDLCDQMGILVWQYFMFACGEYPEFDAGFTENVREEIFQVVERLRNHASIALWVGNVENKMLSEKIRLNRYMYGTRLFEHTIPEWLRELDGDRFYLPGSPYFGETANSEKQGDHHNWDVWFLDVPYTRYGEDQSVFVSEYGIQSLPVAATVKKYMRSEDVDIHSYAFHYLNRDQGNGHMGYLMGTHARLPQNLEEYADLSMYVQAEGLKYAAEHYRRNFPHTCGALIWQLNDCYPVQSWSLIDCDLIPKASYYYAKRFFRPLMISLEEVDKTVTAVWVLNNTRQDFAGAVTAEVRDFFGNRYGSETVDVSVPACSCLKIREIAVGGRHYPNVIIPNRPRHFYLHAFCSAGCPDAYRFFGTLSEVLFPPTRLSVERHDWGIRITASRFARFVKIDGDMEDLKLSDNYFDLEAGQSCSVRILSERGSWKAGRSLFVKALNSEKTTLMPEGGAGSTP